MTTVDVLVTELKLQHTNFQRGMKDVMNTITKTGRGFNGMFSKLTMIVGIFQQIAFTAGVLVAAFTALATSVYGVYIEISSLQIALANSIKDGASATDVAFHISGVEVS